MDATSGAGAPGPGEKTCPWCAETIKAAAIRCRFCQADLTEAPPVREPVVDPAPVPPAAPAAPAEAPGSPNHPARSSLTGGGPVPSTVTPDASAGPSSAAHSPSAGSGTPPARRRRLDGPLPALLLAVVVLLLGAVVVRVLLDDAGGSDPPTGTTPLAEGAVVTSEDAKSAGLVAATEAAETVLSYSAETLDEDVAAAQALLGPAMREEYDATVESIRASTLEDEVTVEARVVAASVVSATPTAVKALLFVNQETTTGAPAEGAEAVPPRLDLNRVLVTLQRADAGDDWTVVDLDAL